MNTYQRVALWESIKKQKLSGNVAEAVQQIQETIQLVKILKANLK